MDGSLPALGRYQACRRVARTIFVGSAPSVAGQRVRGLEEVRIRLGCVQPGFSAATFGDALRRLSNALTYLYTDGSRYWYDTHPTVNKLARDRAQGFPQDEVHLAIVERLRKEPKTGHFAAVHVTPAESAEVVDEMRVRVVVLGPKYTHKRSAKVSPAQKQARHILENRGNGHREYKNMLIFIAPDEIQTEALAGGVSELMAWQSIKTEEEALNLDAQQRQQVKSSLDKAEETVANRVMEAYNWLLVPIQPDPEALGSLEFEAGRIRVRAVFTNAPLINGGTTGS